MVFFVSLLFIFPVFAVAASDYGDCAYGSLTYGGDCTPPVTSSGGGGTMIYGSSPLAPGYVNINPTGAAPITSNIVSSTSAPVSQITTPNFIFTNDLNIGSEGEDVRQLQIFLNAHGFSIAAVGSGSIGNETSYFGLATQAALAKYQKANSITPAIGYFGPKTRASLTGSTSTQQPSTTITTALSTTTVSATFTRDLELGDKGEDVRALQQYLNARGFILANSGLGSPGSETDFFGNATQNQLIQLQKQNGITPAAGYFGSKTRALVSSH